MVKERKAIGQKAMVEHPIAQATGDRIPGTHYLILA